MIPIVPGLVAQAIGLCCSRGCDRFHVYSSVPVIRVFSECQAMDSGAFVQTFDLHRHGRSPRLPRFLAQASTR